MILKSKILHGCNDNFHVRVIWMVLKEHSISFLVFKNLEIGLQGIIYINKFNDKFWKYQEGNSSYSKEKHKIILFFHNFSWMISIWWLGDKINMEKDLSEVIFQRKFKLFLAGRKCLSCWGCKWKPLNVISSDYVIQCCNETVIINHFPIKCVPRSE